ncbi:MAG: HIT domain-containing protein, partial [Nanoarchaeota archaeon]
IKQQLIEQIKTTFPEDKQQETIQEIENMNDEQLIEFLKKNNLIKDSEEKEQKCIFCSMVFGEVPVTKIAENKQAIAILEINTISKGHVLIIPKEHIFEKEKVKEKTKELENEIKKIIKQKLKPKEIITSFSELFQHGIINIIPVYTNENLNSERKQATTQELQEIQEKLIQEEKQEKLKKQEKKQEINEKNTWLPKRIP